MTTPNANQHNETISLLALQKAQSQVGQKEVPKGSNAGPMVNQYLASVGIRPGFPWCQAFLYWCFEQAAKELDVTNPVLKTGGVYACWNNSPDSIKITRAAVLADPNLLQPGMQFALLFPRGVGHTGIVESVDLTAKTFTTIEGNSNTDGKREGFEVVRHTRKFSEAALAGFLKYALYINQLTGFSSLNS